MEFFLPLDVEVTVDIIYDIVERIDMNRIVAFFAFMDQTGFWLCSHRSRRRTEGGSRNTGYLTGICTVLQRNGTGNPILQEEACNVAV
mgnify:CR=1 FL=1